MLVRYNGAMVPRATAVRSHAAKKGVTSMLKRGFVTAPPFHKFQFSKRGAVKQQHFGAKKTKIAGGSLALRFFHGQQATVPGQCSRRQDVETYAVSWGFRKLHQNKACSDLLRAMAP